MASKAYWLARTLGDRGHEIHVITDAINPDDPYYTHDTSIEEDHPNVYIHRAINEVPWLIPQERHSALCLLDKVLEIIETFNVSVICAAYLVPYGLVGCTASSRTGVPLILQHGGSDINKFLIPGIWKSIWANYLSQPKLILTDVDHHAYFSSRGLPIKTVPPYVPNPNIFTPLGKARNQRPCMALIGKSNYYWRHKGWHRIIDIWSGLNIECDFLVISQGLGLKDFRKYVGRKFIKKINWCDFTNPQSMPDILRNIDFLFYFCQDLPYPMFSNILLEALYCGVKIVSDSQSLLSKYVLHNLHVSSWKGNVFDVDANSDNSFNSVVSTEFTSRQLQPIPDKLDFTCYIDCIERALL